MRAVLSKLLTGARTSGLYRRLLNLVLLWKIPFNGPHKPRVLRISDDAVEVLLPFRRSNRNHLGGLHACALATAGEMAAGLRLQTALDSGKFRLIMQAMAVEYVYQGRSDVIARCALSASEIDTRVLQPLASAESVTIEMESVVRNLEDRHICTVRTTWQVKVWAKVKS